MRLERAALAALLLASPASARADAGVGLTGTARCEPLANVGRFRCEVDVAAPPGGTLKWADVQLVAAPPWVTILKGRLAGADTTTRTDVLWRFAFSAVAREKGRGELTLRLRAVACRDGACAPVEASVPAAILVGS